tara:strand:- start:2470 stop:5115 length:2646 start_codon:yes stop_codon:yes gene_type:complete
MKKKLLTEGGAAGHMSHPFDLKSVRNGKDLIGFFMLAQDSLEESPASVKIDGVNVSFKVIGDEQSKQFAVDRGSLKAIDQAGVTVSNVRERFPKNPGTGQEHGMVKSVTKLLTILNRSLPNIEEELKELGLYDDPTKFINAEYVSETTNVTKYEDNFLAFHGINQFYERKDRKGNVVRQGESRPEKSKAVSYEVKYDQSKMQEMIDKIMPVAEKYGFKIYGSIPTEFKQKPKFDSVLSETFSVTISEENIEEKSLKQWLIQADNPAGEKIKVGERKGVGAVSKEVYLLVLNGTPLEPLIEDEKERKKAIDGAIMYHATREMGNIILDSLTSVAGEMRDHEGIVLRDEKRFGTKNPIKITGDFIIGGMQSSFQQANEELKDDSKYIILIPGGFKPPTAGHYELMMEYANSPQVEKVIVFIGDSPRGRFTLDDSLQVFEIYGISQHPKIEIKTVSGSPAKSVYEFIEKGGEAGQYENVKFAMGASSKPDKSKEEITDAARVNEFKRWADANKQKLEIDPEKVDVPPFVAKVAVGKGGMDLSASSFRQAIENEDEAGIDDHIPRFIVGEKGENTGPDNIYNKVMAILRPESLEETSVMGSGAVAIGPVKRAKPKRDKKLKKLKYEKIDRSEFIMDLIQEEKLRKLIRKTIVNIREQQEAEAKLRGVIRKLISEQEEVGGSSFTGINELGDLLKQIMPKIEIHYKKMKTSKGQRDSFRKHLVVNLKNLLNVPIAIADIADQYEKIKADRTEDTEPLALEEDLQIDLTDQPEEEEAAIFDLKGDEEAAEIEQELEKEAEDEVDSLPGEDKTGAAFAADAVNEIDTQVINSFNRVKANPVDRELFVRYLLINALLNMDNYEAEIGEAPETDVPGYEQEKSEIEAELR